MKDQIHTIPVNDAFLSGDECPFCFLERQAEQSAINYAVGPEASYMESDVRGETDELGFCRQHQKMLFDFGNALGSALILQTHYKIVSQELQREMEDFGPPKKKGFLSRRGADPEGELPLLAWARDSLSRCYVCDRISYNMGRYYATFFAMVKDAEFRARVEGCKGFCVHHFAELLTVAQDPLPGAQRDWFYPTVFRLMRENMARVKEDLDWFIEKFDYRNQQADWKNSRDALPRAMQKLRGAHPSDPVFKGK